MLRFLALIVVTLTASCAALAAADQPTPEQMAATMKAMQPGPQHAQMAKLAGSYTVAGKMWMDPAGPAVETKGTAEFTVILDGRYVRQDYKGSMPMGPGQEMPFTGIGLDGYDNVAKK